MCFLREVERLCKARDVFPFSFCENKKNEKAMAMELPVIVTNFSGPTAYLTDDNAFPLSFTLGDGGFAEV